MGNALTGLVYSVARRIRRATRWPPVGSVDLGDLRRLEPLSRKWGYDRGRPVDRHYIEGFLAEHSTDIRGRVLEIKDNAYTVEFGGDRVTQSDVLDVRADNRHATIIADLTAAEHVESGLFDTVICTQTLQLIYDIRAAIETLHRILKPGGVLLATLPGISHITQKDPDSAHDLWRVTRTSAERLFTEVFGVGNVTVQSHGNVLTAIAFLAGLAADELLPEELDANDHDYQAVIVVRAVRRPDR